MDSLIHGLMNFLGQFLYRIFMGTLFLYTGYILNRPGYRGGSNL